MLYASKTDAHITNHQIHYKEASMHDDRHLSSLMYISTNISRNDAKYHMTIQNSTLTRSFPTFPRPQSLNYKFSKMVTVSNQLVWEIVKNNNCFMKKVNGRTRRTGTMRFSVEKSNLLSLSSYKHSGLASTQAVGIASKNDAAVMYTKTASKSASTYTVAETPIIKPFAKVVSTVEKTLAATYYRPDLKDDALAKFSAVYQANRRAKGVKKTVPTKKGRGKN